VEASPDQGAGIDAARGFAASGGSGGNTRKGAWRLSKNGLVKMALPNRYFTQTLGLVLLG
jgi:hypothetical protein